MANLTGLQNRISEEFIISRRQGGIILFRPDNRISNHPLSIMNVMEWPVDIYFLDTDSKVQKINHSAASTCGWVSTQDALGDDLKAVWVSETAEVILSHDREVMQSRQMIMKYNSGRKLTDDLVVESLCIRFPWYDLNSQLLGIFGISISATNNIPKSLSAISETFIKIANLGLLDTGINDLKQIAVPPKTKIEGKNLSSRETQCLEYLMRGKTAKSIAANLGLSTRTVEHYIDNLKVKMGVSFKSQLVEKALQGIQTDLFH